MLKDEGLEALKNLPEEVKIGKEFVIGLREKVLGKHVSNITALKIIESTDGFRKSHKEYIDETGAINLIHKMNHDNELSKFSKAELIILLVDPYKEEIKPKYGLALVDIMKNGEMSSEMTQYGLQLDLTAKSGRKYNLIISKANLPNYPELQKEISTKLREKGRGVKEEFQDYLLEGSSTYQEITDKFESSLEEIRANKLIVNNKNLYISENLALRAFISTLYSLVSLDEEKIKDIDPSKLKGFLVKKLSGSENYKSFVREFYDPKKDLESYKELERLGLISPVGWREKTFSSTGKEHQKHFLTGKV